MQNSSRQILRDWVPDIHAKLPIAAVAVVYAQGKFLLIRRSPTCPAPNYWNAVAGKVESEETVPEAALRELHEETGLRGKVTRYLGKSVTNCNRYQLHWYQVQVDTKEKIIPSDEISDYKWFTTEEITTLSPFFIEDLVFFEYVSELEAGSSLEKDNWQ